MRTSIEARYLRPMGGSPGGRAVTWLLGGLFVLAVLVTMFTGQRAVQLAHERDDAAVGTASLRLAAGLEAALSSLQGADALATDGQVSAAEFDTFASDVVPGSDYDAIAYAEIVADEDRSDWERGSGHPITDSDGAGGFVPAPRRPRYVAVRFVYPASEVARSVLGFDLSGDASRQRALDEALRAPEPVLVGPIRLARSSQPGLFAAHEVRAPDGRALGFLASGINVEAMTDRAAAPDRQAGSIGMSVDGEALVGSDVDGPDTTFEVGGRAFTVRTGARAEPEWGLPLATGLGALVLLAAAVLSRSRDRAEREEEGRARARRDATALLADELAGATTVAETVTAAVRRASALVGCSSCSIGVVDRWDVTKLLVSMDASGANGGAGRHDAVLSLDDRHPMSDCARGRVAIVLADQDALDREYGDELFGDVSSARALLCAPIVAGRADLLGVLCCTWTAPVERAAVRRHAAAAAEIADVVGRALERAIAREAARDHAEQLSDFAAALSTAQTPDQVAGAIRHHAAVLLGAESADLVDSGPEDPASDHRHVRLSTDPDAPLLRLRMPPGGTWDAAHVAIARTVEQLGDAAWVRAKQHDQEHAVLGRLQHTLLAGAPSIPGLDVAVRYQAALDAVGIGGDWYSVIDRPDTTYLVIGDTAGHGPGAVAIMAEVKTIIRHLLTSGTPIDEVVRHADAALQRRNALASAVIVSIDKVEPRISYMNAGHPYPIVTSPGMPAVLLERTHRPWLGLPTPTSQLGTHDFPSGSTLLLYTDGMVEQRGTPISESLGRLTTMVDGLGRVTSDEMVDSLLSHRLRSRDERTVDDDIALIAVTRL